MAVALIVPVTSAQAVDIVRIEEDWELVVKEPDPSTQAPQVTCATSPVGDVDSVYAALTINHKTLPDFEAGGLQLQVWNGSSEVSSAKFPHDELLGTDGETVTWTLAMRVEGGQLHFDIPAGQSTTWGSLGQGNMSQSVPTDLTNLNGYDPSVSVANSGVGFAGNRVTSLKLKAVRAYSAEGLVSEDTNPKVVYPHD